MIAHRLEALRRLERANGVACVALVPGANLRYFTGLNWHLSERPAVVFAVADATETPARRGEGRVDPAPADAALAEGGGTTTPLAVVLPALEVPAAQTLLPSAARLFAYSDKEGHEHVFHQVAEELDLAGAPIAVEYLSMRLLEMRRIQQAFPDSPLLAVEPWLPELRMTKGEIEIAHLRRAVAIAEEALRRLLHEGAIRAGRTEREVAGDLQIALLRAGSQEAAFPPIVVGGPNSASPHASPSDRVLVDGDLVVVDWGAVYEGYRSDITRSFVLGEPAAEAVAIHDAVLAANQSGRLAARPGAPAQEIDRAARRAITLAGYGEFFIHRTGHGLGLETHEPPYLVEGNLELMRPGMTFTVEPGIYLPDVGGVRIEDDVLLTAEGAETLTTLPRELISLPGGAGR